MQPSAASQRDYSTISPSAKALLLMKGLTQIPYARRAAELMRYPETYVPDYHQDDFKFWARVLHFEARYYSVDWLLSRLSVQNILELSSGFSFRGLNAVVQNNVHYIDTDLPGVTEVKKSFTDMLIAESPALKGRLDTLPLNALDDVQFAEIINRFAPGEVAIVNEGLLMYLNKQEKEKLCRIIHQVLKQRGGCWITADVYTKVPQGEQRLFANDKLGEFFKMHRIEENKFDSYEAAKVFFEQAGFSIEQVAEPDYSKYSSLPHFLKSYGAPQPEMMNRAGKMRATWQLKAI